MEILTTPREWSMRQAAIKTRNLIFAPGRLERMLSLAEIRFNNSFLPDKPPGCDIKNFAEFLHDIALVQPELFALLKPAGEAEQAVRTILSNFGKLRANNKNLPYPLVYNADKSIAMLCYALTRYIKPATVVETGVAYGITTALILLAMERNNIGRLISVDLPSLSDPHGSYVGMAIPKYLTHRWTSHLGSSRRWLPKILSEMGNIELFIADDANIYTLQRYEFTTVWARLSLGGAAIVNHIGNRFYRILQATDTAQVHTIRQMEKPSCVTGLILKK
jgi:hypothetical protein